MARAGLADLFLDSLNYNAHTTATDALYVGVPLLTMAASDKMQSRVAAGLAVAAGAPHSVVASLREYEDVALRLIQREGALRRQREAMLARISTTTNYKEGEGEGAAPLLEPARWVRCWEVALRRIVRSEAAGAAAADVVLEGGIEGCTWPQQPTQQQPKQQQRGKRRSKKERRKERKRRKAAKMAKAQRRKNKRAEQAEGMRKLGLSAEQIDAALDAE